MQTPIPVQILRTSTPNRPPTSGSLLPGSLGVEMASPVRLWVGVPSAIDASQRRLVFDSSAVAPIASPQLLGVPTAPTAALETNSGQLATTAFVQSALAASTASIVVSATAPTPVSQGKAWFDSVSTNLFIGFNNQWVVAVNNGVGGGGGSSAWGSITGTLSAQADLNTALTNKQDALISGTNLKTINGTSLLGSGDLAISGGPGSFLPLTGGALSGPLRINTSGVAPPATTGAQVLQLASTGDTAVAIDSAGSTGVPRITIRRAAGALDALAALPTSAQLGFVEFRGWTGAAWAGGANIQCTTTQAWNTGSAPVRMDFQTTPAGSVLPTLRMWIGPNGGLVVGDAGGGDRGPGTLNAEAVYCVGNLNVGQTIYIAGAALVLGPPNSAGPGFRTVTIPNF